MVGTFLALIASAKAAGLDAMPGAERLSKPAFISVETLSSWLPVSRFLAAVVALDASTCASAVLASCAVLAIALARATSS